MASAKKVDVDYKVVLTLSPEEARYVSVVLGRICGSRPVDGVWSVLNDLIGQPHSICENPAFDYSQFNEETKNWVLHGPQ